MSEQRALAEDEHPLDESLGDVHEIALSLSHLGFIEHAAKLAKAHETIQNYLIEKELP